MSWFAEGRTEIDYALPPVGWSGKNPEKSDHTFCSRPNNATKSRGDLSSKLKDIPSTYESPSCDKPPSKKSSPSEDNISSSSPGSSSVRSSPRCSTPTQCDETKPSQLSGKQPLTKSKCADGYITVSSPTPKSSSEGSSRATVKKRKLSRLSNKRLAEMSRKTEDTIAQQLPKLFKDSVAQSAEQSPSSSSNSSLTTPSFQLASRRKIHCQQQILPVHPMGHPYFLPLKEWHHLQHHLPRLLQASQLVSSVQNVAWYWAIETACTSISYGNINRLQKK